jgi:antitoxin component YwqK of YwqJK toxin-antitoxin module
MYVLGILMGFASLIDAHAAKDVYSKEKCPSGSVVVGKAPPKGFERHCELPDGRRNGPTASWFSDGQVEEHGYWRADKKHGLWETWYEDGVKKSSCELQDGQRDGLCETWFPNGNKENSTTLKKGLRHGEFKAYYDSGQVLEAALYEEDRLTGMWREWYPNGEKRFEAEYVQGIRSGNWRSFNMSGVATETGFFESDWRSGKWAFFYDDGSKKQSGEFRHDQRVGLWTNYYPKTAIKRSKGPYVQDKEQGPWAYYDEAGDVKEFVYYEKGDRVVEVSLAKSGAVKGVECTRIDDRIAVEDDSPLNWPRTPASESSDPDLRERLADGYVYDTQGDFSPLDELDRFECLATACSMTKQAALCDEVEAVRSYLRVSLELVGESDSAELHPLIERGHLQPIDEATVIPTLSWLLQALPGDRATFGESAGGGEAAMAAEHALARNLLPRESWDAYVEGTMKPACNSFVEATGGDESLWPEVLSAKELWETEDEMVRTVLSPKVSRTGIFDTNELPALTVNGTVSDWIGEWPVAVTGDHEEGRLERQQHARLMRTTVLVRVCAGHLGSSFGTKYLQSTYARFRNSSSSGWGFVRLVYQLLEGLPSAERTVGGLWQVHWAWSRKNGYEWTLPEYIDRATKWLGKDWRESALGGVSADEVGGICESAPYPGLCEKKWTQLLEDELAQTQSLTTPDADVVLRSSSRGTVRCSGEALAFDGEIRFVVAGYQLPATCLVDIGGERQVFQVYGGGEIRCNEGNSGVECDRAVVP